MNRERNRQAVGADFQRTLSGTSQLWNGGSTSGRIINLFISRIANNLHVSNEPNELVLSAAIQHQLQYILL
jgi:hypothetical protein